MTDQECGSNSMVEAWFSKPNVVGSNPIFRSRSSLGVAQLGSAGALVVGSNPASQTNLLRHDSEVSKKRHR